MRWVYLTGLAMVIGTLIADIWVHIDYRVAANVSLIYIAVLSTAFAILYGVRSKWRTNRIGKVFLVKSALLSAVLIQAAVAVWISTEYPNRHIFRFIIYSAGAVAYIPMLVTLWREQQRDRKAAEVTHPPEPS